MVQQNRTPISTRKPIILILLPVVIGLVIYLTTAMPAEAMEQQTFEAQLPDNTECLLCHSKPDQFMELPSGEILSVTIDLQHFGDGAHSGVSCQVCHANISGYPHPENIAQTAREYTLQYQNLCKNCHDVQAKELRDSAHTKLFEAGNQNAPICADCHDAHTDKIFAKTEDGKLAPHEHARVANICARCHSTIFEDYAQSVHGSGVIVDKNPDVPSCTDCHGVHTITGPMGDPSFRLTSPNICAKCHTDETIMDKYGLSTQVLQTYISDFHGTTVAIFEKTDPDQQINMPVCYDCHGIHDIRRADDPEKGLQVKENLLSTCQRCHPDATTNFPDAWLSHYIPTPERYPLVFYVGLFYKILIPLVLGAMALFILTDIYRRVFRDRRNKGKGEIVSAETKSTQPSESGDSEISQAKEQ